MQPGAERGFPAEGSDFPEQLNENVLHEIFGVCLVAHHPQTQVENPPPVLFVMIAQSPDVASLGSIHNPQVARSSRYWLWSL